MKLPSVSAAIMAGLSPSFQSSTSGPYYFASQPGYKLNTCLNLTAVNNHILLGNDLPAYQFLLQLGHDLVGNLSVVGFSEGYSYVYADSTSGIVRFESSGGQPPVANQWRLTASESLYNEKILQFRGGSLWACDGPTAGAFSLLATASEPAGCQLVTIKSLSGQERHVVGSEPNQDLTVKKAFARKD